MLWLAGLLGLMAVGGAAMSDIVLDNTDDETDADSGSDMKRNAVEDAEPEATMGDLLSGLTVDTVTGTNHGDVLSGKDTDSNIHGDGGDDQINGYGGDDTLTGGDGDDVLTGEDGDDVLHGQDGADTLHGAEGDDTLSGGENGDQMFGHNGADLIEGGAGNDTGHGGQGDDSLVGRSGDDALHGNAGNDSLAGGDGADTLFGGFGDDLITDSSVEADYLNGGDGADTIFAGVGDIVTAGAGNDTVLLTSQTATDVDTNSAPTILMDFDQVEDRLLMIMDPGGEDVPEVALQPDDDTPGLQHILVNGAAVASVHGAEGLTLDDILLVDPATAATFLDPAA
ncbi:MAG: calcium-binding protein [Paracoccaceae bacterium]